MTREEAVEVLKERYLTCVGIGLDNHANRVNEAIDMAIEALKANDEDEPQFYTEDDYWNGMFAGSAEAYNAWTGEEMGGKSDLVSREDALEQMAQAECGLHYDDCEADNCSCSYIQRILDIPSADRPTGEWINQDNGAFYPYECSNCHEQPFCDDYGYHLTNYCPNCGAKMDGNTDKPHGFTADEWYRDTFKDGDAE